MIDSADTDTQAPTDEINDPLPNADADWTTSRRKRLLGKTVEIQGAGASGTSRNVNRGTPIDFGFVPFQLAPQEVCSPGHSAPGNYAIQRVESLTEERVRMLAHIRALEKLARERTWDLAHTKVMLEDKTEQYEIRCKEIDAILHQGDNLRAWLAKDRQTIDELRGELKEARRKKQPSRRR